MGWPLGSRVSSRDDGTTPDSNIGHPDNNVCLYRRPHLAYAASSTTILAKQLKSVSGGSALAAWV